MDSSDADNDPYSRLIPRERVHVGSADSDGEEAVDGDETPRNQSLSGVDQQCIHQAILGDLIYTKVQFRSFLRAAI